MRPYWRTEIQGLRGIAIVAVILEHLGLPVRSGFLGVDVFIVISGFVITGVIYRQRLTTGRFSLLHFLSRRIRRLVPTKLVVVCTTTILTGFVMSRELLESTAITAFYGLTFRANQFLFEKSYDYFAPESRSLPLRHLWSLSVEEQFYLGFSIVLVVIQKISPKVELKTPLILLASASLLLVAVCSGLFSFEDTVFRDIDPQVIETFLFYSPFSRAWQFAAGGLAYFATKMRTGKVYPAASISVLSRLGKIMWISLLVVLLIANSSENFSSVSRFSVVILSSLILYSPPSCLAYGPLVAVGNRSYSLYLWHWPLIVILREASSVLEINSVSTGIIAVMLCAVFAEITFRTTEIPYMGTLKPEGISSTRETLRILCVLSLTFLSVRPLGRFVDNSLYSSDETTASSEVFRLDNWYRSTNCQVEEGQFKEVSCGEISRSDFVVIGDSHSWSVGPAVVTLRDSANFSTALRAKLGCSIFVVNQNADCDAWKQSIFEELLLANNKPIVLLIGCARIADPCPSGLLSSSTDEFVKSANEQIKKFEKLGIQTVAIVGDIPILDRPPNSYFRKITNRTIEVAIRHPLWDALNGKRLLELANTLDLKLVPSANVYRGICDATKCKLRDQDSEFWIDSDHLSLDGALELQNSFQMELQKLRAG